jgi:hypothetical protein
VQATKPIFEPILRVPEPDEAEQIHVGFDEEHAFIATPSALWRTARELTSSSRLELIDVGRGRIHALYVEPTGVYLLKDLDTHQSGHTFLRSRDGFDTFDFLDAGLEVEEVRRRAALVPTRMSSVAGALFTNAGGGVNFLVSTDDTRTWAVLEGTFATQICYAGKFLVLDKNVILGGECPLDNAYLTKGTLLTNRSGWASKPRSVAPEDLSNRNVQFISELKPWKKLAAGVEGGLLLSEDGGDTWTWAIQFGASDSAYPYLKQCSLVPNMPDALMVGGFDKAKDGLPYLSLSTDRGRNWIDVSASANSLGADIRQLSLIVIHPDQRLLIAVSDIKRKEVVVAALTAI